MVSGPEHSGATVLLVDDDDAVLGGLESILASRCRVLTASSAAQAAVALKSRQVQVVVSDYKMPGQNGLSFLIDVKESYPDTVRVLMTAFADMDLVIRALNEGEIHRFISKPFRSLEFSAIIDDCLRLAAVRAHSGMPPAKSRTLLAAHDSSISLSTLRVVLGSSYRMLTTSNGLEVLSTVSTAPVDALVLGIGLEMLDGCTICAYLRKEKKVSFPILFWSRDISTAIEEHLRGCGADMCFDEASPQATAELKDYLARHLR